MTAYIAWRNGKNFTPLWHITHDAKRTVCGRRPEGRISVWDASVKGHKDAPDVVLQCAICRRVEFSERTA